MWTHKKVLSGILVVSLFWFVVRASEGTEEPAEEIETNCTEIFRDTVLEFKTDGGRYHLPPHLDVMLRIPAPSNIDEGKRWDQLRTIADAVGQDMARQETVKQVKTLIINY